MSETRGGTGHLVSDSPPDFDATPGVVAPITPTTGTPLYQPLSNLRGYPT